MGVRRAPEDEIGSRAFRVVLGSFPFLKESEVGGQ